MTLTFPNPIIGHIERPKSNHDMFVVKTRNGYEFQIIRQFDWRILRLIQAFLRLIRGEKIQTKAFTAAVLTAVSIPSLKTGKNTPLQIDAKVQKAAQDCLKNILAMKEGESTLKNLCRHFRRPYVSKNGDALARSMLPVILKQEISNADQFGYFPPYRVSFYDDQRKPISHAEGAIQITQFFGEPHALNRHRIFLRFCSDKETLFTDCIQSLKDIKSFDFRRFLCTTGGEIIYRCDTELHSLFFGNLKESKQPDCQIRFTKTSIVVEYLQEYALISNPNCTFTRVARFVFNKDLSQQTPDISIRNISINNSTRDTLTKDEIHQRLNCFQTKSVENLAKLKAALSKESPQMIQNLIYVGKEFPYLKQQSLECIDIMSNILKKIAENGGVSPAILPSLAKEAIKLKWRWWRHKDHLAQIGQKIDELKAYQHRLLKLVLGIDDITKISCKQLVETLEQNIGKLFASEDSQDPEIIGTITFIFLIKAYQVFNERFMNDKYPNANHVQQPEFVKYLSGEYIHLINYLKN